MNTLSPLSEREIEVLKLVATGATNQQIAHALVISPNTVKVHLRNIFEKLAVQSRTEATMEAVRRGWVPVGSAVLPEGASPLVGTPAAAVVVNLPTAPARRPLPLWQRIYMLIALVAVALAALAPAWYQRRSQAAPITMFSDVGQPQVTLAALAEVAPWMSGAPLPAARSRLALVTDEQRIYAIGGETADGVTGRVDVYDPKANGWLSAARKLTPVSNAGAAVLDGRIYVPGGIAVTGGATNVLEVYDPRTDAWTPRMPLPAPLAAYGLAVLDGKLYLFGGWDGAQYRAESHIYDPAADQWTLGVPLPTPRGFLAAAAAADKRLYVVGGFDGKQELAEVLAYDPSAADELGRAWRQRAALDQPRAGHSLAAVGSRLYAIGGGWRTALAYNEQYDIKLDAWSRISTPVAGQWRNLGLATYEQRLFAFGGWSGAYLDVNQQYQALYRQLLPLSGSGGG